MTSGPLLVVAIDGPSGAGKTAAGALLAQRIGAVLVDTGVFYRALTVLAMQERVSPDDENRLVELVPRLSAAIRLTAESSPSAEVLLDGRPFGDDIFAPDVDARVSRVASHRAVRAALLDLQRAPAEGRRAVVTGRDVGTVVFPGAVVKIYLDASIEERARRRSRQVGGDGIAVTQSMTRRDALDAGRTTAPLVQARDAIRLDTDDLTVEQVVDRLEVIFQQRVESP
ncbi:MAG: (d)CMP kinase [Chloroflexi bacterium]|nr:(d)CMP kinase [Chloroflexota bacterium]